MNILNTTYDIYTNQTFLRRVAIPVFSAELHLHNKSEAVRKQLDGLELALKENKALRLFGIVVEILNPYENIMFYNQIMLFDESGNEHTKTYNYWGRTFSTVPLWKNPWFLLFTFIYGTCGILCSENWCEYCRRCNLADLAAGVNAKPGEFIFFIFFCIFYPLGLYITFFLECR